MRLRSAPSIRNWHQDSPAACCNLAEILSVEGIDVFFVGPGDLSKTLGLHGQRFHPTVRGLVVDAGRTIVGNGKIAGTLVKRDNAADHVDARFRVLYEHANTLLADGAQRFKTAVEGGK